MKVKKRKKATRFRGSHTHGRGGKKKARGSGHRGGKGMAGTGKRGDQRKTLVTKLYGGDYFGKSKRKLSYARQTESVSLRSVTSGIEGLKKKGVAKQTKEGYEIDLKDYKLIGQTDVKDKLFIKAKSASKGAQESVKKAGGNISFE